MPTFLLAKTYREMIKNSPGTKLFRHFYAKNNAGVEEDLLQDGQLSCASFVSAILYQIQLFQLIKTPHATVSGTVKDMEEVGWQKTTTPQQGDVIVWAPITELGAQHQHIGFWINEETAISNSTSQGVPIEHHLTFGTRENGEPVRPIIAIYTHPTFFRS